MAAPEGNNSSAQAANFKAFLMKEGARSGQNLYEHLTRILTKVMDEHPDDAVDVLDALSHDVKQRVFKGVQMPLRNVSLPSAAELLAEKQRLLFTATDDPVQETEMMGSVLQNLNEVAFYLEQAGVGLGREETQRIFLALKHLVESHALMHCRLWGKILGTERNYIIAEAVDADEEEELEQGAEEAPEEEKKAEVKEKYPVPQSTYKPPPQAPKEVNGTGANKYVYYVCNEPGLPWVKLPSVKPAQISTARQIRKFFTGRLDNPILSYPPFPGNEAYYLRAQIARISAGTQVSPKGFYQLVEKEDDEADELSQLDCEVNLEFEEIPVDEMTSLSMWVHHVQHILQQGRCVWANLAVKSKEDPSEEEEDDEEDEEEHDMPEPEVGPPLLTSLSKDAEKKSPEYAFLDFLSEMSKLSPLRRFLDVCPSELFNTPPWTSRLSSTLTPQHAIAVLRSNLWPGAHAYYACGKKFENIYIGWGLKKAGTEYSPPLPPPPQKEYPSGPEITEALDPTPEDEQELEKALEEQQAARDEMVKSEEEEEEDEDDDDEEDD